MNENEWVLKFSADQPRVPAGSPEGGRWTSGGGGGKTVLSGSRRGPEKNEPDLGPFQKAPGESPLEYRERAIAHYETLADKAVLKPLPRNRYLKPGERVFILPKEGGVDPANRFGLVNTVRGNNNPAGRNPLEKEPWTMVNPDSLWDVPFNGKGGANPYLPDRLMLFAGWKE